MAQIKTRWFSAKLSSITNLNNSQRDDETLPEFLNAYQVAGGSFQQAGKPQDSEPPPQCTSMSYPQLTSKPSDGVCIRHFKQSKADAPQTAQNEMNSSTIDATHTGKLKKTAGKPKLLASEFSYWLPYNYMKAMHKKMNETKEDNSSGHKDDNVSDAVLSLNNEDHSAADAERSSSSSSNTGKRLRLAYKCPRKYPKYKARLAETTQKSDDSSRKASGSESLMECISCKSNLVELEQDCETAAATNRSINRNTTTSAATTPSSKSFQILTNAELKLDLRSLYTSLEQSSMDDDLASFVSSNRKMLATAPIENLSAYVEAISTAEHEEQLKPIEELDDELVSSIELSIKHQKAACDGAGTVTKPVEVENVVEIKARKPKSKTYQHTTKRVIGGREARQAHSQIFKLDDAKAENMLQNQQREVCFQNTFRSDAKNNDYNQMPTKTAFGEQESSLNETGRTYNKASTTPVSSDRVVKEELFTKPSTKFMQESDVKEKSKLRSTSQQKQRKKAASGESKQQQSGFMQNETLEKMTKCLKSTMKELKHQTKVNVHAKDKEAKASQEASKKELPPSPPIKTKPNLRRKPKECQWNCSSSCVSNETKVNFKPPNKQPSKQKETMLKREISSVSAIYARNSSRKSESSKSKEPQNKHKENKQTIKPKRAQCKKAIEKSESLVFDIDFEDPITRTSLHDRENGKHLKIVFAKTSNESIAQDQASSKTKTENKKFNHQKSHKNISKTRATQVSSSSLLQDQNSAADFSNLTARMDLKSLLNPQTSRSEAISAVLKFRYKTLIERAHGEYALLQHRKARYKAKGLHERISAVRMQQQKILKKMEFERKVLQTLLESALLESSLISPLLEEALLPKPNSYNGTISTTAALHSKSSPILGCSQSHTLSLKERLDRVEYLLSWNFKLDEKESDIAEMEQKLLICNDDLDITPKTSAKSLLKRITKVENRLARINEKLVTIKRSVIDLGKQNVGRNCLNSDVPDEGHCTQQQMYTDCDTKPHYNSSESEYGQNNGIVVLYSPIDASGADLGSNMSVVNQLVPRTK